MEVLLLGVGGTIFYTLNSKSASAPVVTQPAATQPVQPRILGSTADFDAAYGEPNEIMTDKQVQDKGMDRYADRGARLRPLFLQLPPAFGPTQLSQLQAFLDYWPAHQRLAVEVRHPGFYKVSHAPN